MTARKENNRPASKSAKNTKLKKLGDGKLGPTDADNTAPKQRRDEVLAKHAFKPGQSGNPAGRPRGARSKLSAEFFDDLYTLWKEQGFLALRKMAIHAPASFVKMTAMLMPKEFDIKKPVEQLSDAELADLIAVVHQLAEQISPDGPIEAAGPSPTPPN